MKENTKLLFSKRASEDKYREAKSNSYRLLMELYKSSGTSKLPAVTGNPLNNDDEFIWRLYKIEWVKQLLVTNNKFLVWVLPSKIAFYLPNIFLILPSQICTSPRRIDWHSAAIECMYSIVCCWNELFTSLVTKEREYWLHPYRWKNSAVRTIIFSTDMPRLTPSICYIM